MRHFYSEPIADNSDRDSLIMSYVKFYRLIGKAKPRDGNDDSGNGWFWLVMGKTGYKYPDNKEYGGGQQDIQQIGSA
jgi:hypothetical protein